MLITLCIKIFIARIVEVSLSTFVTILTVKNKRLIAALLSFVDVIIWFIAVKEALNTNIQSILIPLSYALGYAIGTFIGTTLSNNLIKGNVSVKVVTDKISQDKMDEIISNGYALTYMNCYGKDNSPKLMLFIEVEKKHLHDLKILINKIDNNAFMIIDETKFVQNGFFK